MNPFELEAIPPNYFRLRYTLRGRDWIRTITPEDLQAFARYGFRLSDYGRQGGQARARTCQRDSRGRFKAGQLKPKRRKTKMKNYATFERFEIELTEEQALSGSHQGQCDEDIKYLLSLPVIRRQFKHIKADDIKAELSEYGAWDETELSDIEENKARILWIACGNVLDEINKRKK